jgi:two-component system chemotaxis response regulator CheB
MRTLLRSVVSSDSRLEVAGTASDGLNALQSLDSLRPDLVLLDVEMPGMDGLKTLKQMKARGKSIPVIMCSALTQRGAKVTIEALASGAADYVAKPSGQSSREAAIQTLARDLVPKILALTAHATAAPGQAFGQASAFPPRGLNSTVQALPVAVKPIVPPSGLSFSSSLLPQILPPQSINTVPPAVVLIGVSTGGPAALDILLPKLPASFPVPILIVQHMPEIFTRLLAERLNSRCPMRVCEATSGEPIRPGTIYIAKGDWHMEIDSPESRPGGPSPHVPLIRLTQVPPENHCRPAVDVLFRTGVAHYGPRVLGVVLTGMGYDGLAGSRIIREHGGTIIAQDQPTSAVWGMPGAVAHAGLAHRILPLQAIAPEILRLTSRSQREAFELRESAV